MIWFFGTSHTDGFADGQKHLDQLTYTEIVGEKTKHDYINFGTSGINNLLIYKFMKIMLESKKYKKPDIIIIEPRSYYDYVSFPRLFNDGKMTYDEITWRNKNDAYYTGYHNDYVKNTTLITIGNNNMELSMSNMNNTVINIHGIRNDIRRNIDDLHNSIRTVLSSLLPRNNGGKRKIKKIKEELSKKNKRRTFKKK